MVVIETSQIATRKVARLCLGIDISLSKLSLPLIMLFQSIVSLTALRNTAFQDEALYLLAGRQIFNSWIGKPHFLDPYGLYFSGYPSFYPVIGGVLNMLGGVELARMFSLLCMLGVTAVVYYMTKYFFDLNSAILASALFACQASVLFIGRLATYDALCLSLLALATVLVLHTSTARKPWAALGIGPLLVLAVAAKYAGLLFVSSVLALLVWCSFEKQGWRKMLTRTALALLSLVITSVVALLSMDKEVLTGLSFTTTNRVSFIKTPAVLMLQHVAILGGIIFVLALLALFLVGWRRLPAGLLLFGSSLLAPAYHIYKGELVSLDKHLAFSMFFAVPLAAFAIVHLASGFRLHQAINRYLLSALAIYLIIFSLGLQQAQNIYAGWAPSSDLTYLLRTQIRLGSGRYLVEDFDVARYYSQDVSYPWQWNSLDFFSYTDKQKHYLLGEDAYRSAIREGYFDVVELSYGYNAKLAFAIEGDMKASKNYDFVTRIPYHNSYGNGYFWIWRKHVEQAKPSL